MKPILSLVNALAITSLVACTSQKDNKEIVENEASDSTAGLFQSDVNFLKKYTGVIVLEDSTGNSKIAVCAALQGRVMTSTSSREGGLSYGWINRQAFQSGDTSEHINVFGGEDRFWLGPEGGQFSIYFEKGKEFNLDNWHVPRLIDLEPFASSSATKAECTFTKEGVLKNYSGTVFNVAIERKIKILENNEAWKILGLNAGRAVSLVAYQSQNKLINTGSSAWTKETGMLSIWILGMFKPTAQTTIIIPYRNSKAGEAEFVNDVYFGKVPKDRLTTDDHAVYFKGDGKYRSKIGLKEKNATGWMASYDSANGVLTLVNYSQPENKNGYVNSLWAIQKDPFNGDVINAYNDGPPAPGAKPLGPFFELESSSPAAALKPGESISHTHTTFHITGSSSQLNPIVMKVLGVTIEDIAGVSHSQ
jgi:hypothetical protein